MQNPIEFKRDLRVIIPYTLFTCGALAALCLGKIKVEVFLAILGALNVASAFGLKKEDPPPPLPDDIPTVRVLSTPPPASKPLPRVNTLIMMLLLCACGEPLTPAQKAALADSTFAGEMQACVAAAHTVDESHRCRADVRAKWHVEDGGAPDGGAP